VRYLKMGKKGFKEIVAEISPNLAQYVSLQIHEAEQIPNRVNPKKSMLRHMTIK
jgi:hypothetical protein